MVRPDHKDWSNKLNDALWAYRPAYKTPIGTTPYRLVYGKGCHLPVELAHCALWAVKNINLDYERADKIKRDHDAKLRRKTFKKGQRVWLYNLRVKLFPGKLKSKWAGPYQVKRFGKFGEVEIEDFDNHLR
ncbi:uncharacterized protein LOC143627681 [Bidens hawaiensis]|uniref:uncharacterized protein LOC143627681 n=1 Tax=Bidens hawaiensis TaxID=980011 RepID=UPI004048F0E0